MELSELTYKRRIINAEGARDFYSIHNRRQTKIEKSFVPKIASVIRGQLQSFITAIHNYGYVYAKNRIDSIIQIEPAAIVIRDLYHKSAYIESNYVMNYLNRKKSVFIEDMEVKRIGHGASFGLSLDSLAPIIDRYFDIYLLNNSAIPITNTTRKMIINHLIREVDGGKDLETALQDFTDLAITGGGSKAIIRAVGIAKSESTKAMSFGGIIGAYMTGIDVDKVWVTSDDERVRTLATNDFSHVALDLNKAEMLGSFYNGEAIRFPGDPEASLSNTSGCRCAMYFRQKARPKPTIARSLVNFLTDFITGFNLNLF